MRIGYSEDENFPGQFALWQANCDRSLAGRKGQAVLGELKAALLALPSRRLIADQLDDGIDCCAIGALVRHKGLSPKADPECAMEEVGVECGMPRLVAWMIVELNDVILQSRSPEERYVAVLDWVGGHRRMRF